MSYDSQFLKWRMEQVWQKQGCVSPNHLARWTTYEKGYRVYDKERSMILLYFTTGSIRRGKLKKVKGKGFSFLSKSYKYALDVQRNKKKAAANCTCSLPHARPWWWCKTHGEVTVSVD